MILNVSSQMHHAVTACELRNCVEKDDLKVCGVRGSQFEIEDVYRARDVFSDLEERSLRRTT